MIAYIRDGSIILISKTLSKTPPANSVPLPILEENAEFNPQLEGRLGPEVVIESNKVRLIYTIVNKESSEAIANVRANLLTEVREVFEAKSNLITSSYPSGEVNTWDQQKAEAKAYTIDNNAPIPILSRIASGRNIPIEVLVARVIAKTNAYLAYLGDLLGRKQALEDLLEADNMTLVELSRIKDNEINSGWL